MGRRLCGAVRSCIWGHFVLGLVLFGLYILWLITAQIIYAMTMRPEVPTLIMGFPILLATPNHFISPAG